MEDNVFYEDSEPTIFQQLLRMPRSVWALVAILVLIASLITVGLNGHPKSTQATGTAAEVTININGFTPAELHISVGSTVTFKNADGSASHWVASDPFPTDDGLPSFNSREALQPGDSYSYTFKKPGRFTYHDQLNPYTYDAAVVVN